MEKRIRLILFLLGFPFIIMGQVNFDRGLSNGLFVRKGTYMGGVTFSYSEHSDRNYQLMILDEVDSRGYTFKVSPYFGYFIKNNVALGGRFMYNRTFTDLGNLKLNLGDDMTFEVSDARYLEHLCTGSFFIRTYMPLGNNKIFGLFNEAFVGYGYGQGKNQTGTGKDLSGTFQTIQKLQIGFSPGLSAFVSNFAAVEVSIGMLGWNAKWINQTTDQIEMGYRRTSQASFKVDIFSINIGVNLYF